MNSVIEKLQIWRDEIAAQIAKDKNNELIQDKNEVEDALFALNFCLKYKISKKDIEKVVELPELNTGISEYRIMNDCETDNRDLWVELIMEDESIRCSENDILIKKK